MKNVIILGAAGRDFHDFMVYWSLQSDVTVKCFTETQIPGIEYRTFPPEMCHNDKNGNRYSDGLLIYPEEQLENLIKRFEVDCCALAYSDLSYDTVQALAARVTAAGASFVQLPPKLTMLPSVKPVIAICATRTGTGKSQTTRYVANYLKKKGKKIAVVRHPMPYDQVLLNQRCQRYEKLDDLEKYKCTIEEREEYELHIEEGNLLFAGVDYEMILHEAEKDADVVIWDGGNNDFSFFKPDLQITVCDALRANHGTHYFPGEVNIKLADAILINKVNSLPNENMARDQENKLKELVGESTPIYFGNSIVTVDALDMATGKNLSISEATDLVRGKRVLVVDDGPTLTHGGMPFGAGYVLAENLKAAEIVDPRPHAKGSLIGVFHKFTHLEKVLPAMGYGEKQIRDLEETILDADQNIDCIITGTPIDLSRVIRLNKPCVRARYKLELTPSHEKPFLHLLDRFVE